MIDFEQELYNRFGQVKDFTLGMRIAKYFYELGASEKPNNHLEQIVCPKCGTIQAATVEHTAPFYSYVHTCEKCGYTILESEWEHPNIPEGLDVTDFCKPIDPGIAQCIADHSWEMLGEDEKPVPKDLEEAADEMAIRAFPEKKSYSTVIDRVVDYNAVDRKNYRDGIIAGAKWQEEQDLKYISEIHRNGYNLCKEQMLKEAVKMYPCYDEEHNLIGFSTDYEEKGAYGQLIRVIIIKED